MIWVIFQSGSIFFADSYGFIAWLMGSVPL
jgi:hypothetical protein